MSTKEPDGLESDGLESDDVQAMVLDADETTEKRAKWESFAFVIPTAGKVNVANHSYGDEEAREHTYTVTVDAGGPIDCTCPAFEYHCQPGEACKHMLAVMETEPVLVAVLRSVAEDRDDGDDEPELVTDGGQVVDADADTERPEECNCRPRSEGLACFPCFNAGFETPNPDATEDEDR